MKFLLDTANLEDIKYFNEYFPIVGVTTNPTILAREDRGIGGYTDYGKILVKILYILKICGIEEKFHRFSEPFLICLLIISSTEVCSERRQPFPRLYIF